MNSLFAQPALAITLLMAAAGAALAQTVPWKPCVPYQRGQRKF
jgi:hypothetical protein